MPILTSYYKKPTIVKVAFPTSRKSYFYKYFGFDINKGDTVVVLTPNNGYLTATVECVNSFDALEASEKYKLKWVVQKVDKRIYQRLLELDEEQKCSVYEISAIDEYVGPVFVTSCNVAFTKRDTHTCEECKRELDWDRRQYI